MVPFRAKYDVVNPFPGPWPGLTESALQADGWGQGIWPAIRHYFLPPAFRSTSACTRATSPM
jgi:hypothetical protein